MITHSEIGKLEFNAITPYIYIGTNAHCQNGHGRAPTLVAAYLINQGMEAGKAIEFIKSKRPVIHINEEQQEALKEFENSKTLRLESNATIFGVKR